MSNKNNTDDLYYTNKEIHVLNDSSNLTNGWSHSLQSGQESESEYVQDQESLRLQESDKGHLQEVWSKAVKSELDSVATFDPRPNGQSSVDKEKWFHYYNKWRKCSGPQLAALSPEVPNSLPAYIAVFRPEGEQGVDFRPHIFDANLGNCLVDSGSQVTAFPPDPGDKQTCSA